MPRDDSGNYSLPSGSEAVTGTTIQASTHNTPLADIAQALTGSLARNGAGPMLAPLKLVDGTLAAPAVAFNSETGTGLILTGNGIGFVKGGVLIAEIGSGGFTAGVPVGAGMDFWGTTAPAGWIFAYGQALSRTTYAALFDKFGTTFGPGNGTTTFNVPDKRGRSSFGKDDMGGTSANRITSQSGGWDGDTLGASGGAETHTLTVAQLPASPPSGSVTVSYPAQQYLRWASGAAGLAAGSNFNLPTGDISSSTTPPGNQNFSLSMSNLGSGQAHNNLPPGISCNYIIFAGV